MTSNQLITHALLLDIGGAIRVTFRAYAHEGRAAKRRPVWRKGTGAMTVRPFPGLFSAICILGDQHRAQALSCNGDPNVSTPHIDRLAAEGLNVRGVFDVYAPGPDDRRYQHSDSDMGHLLPELGKLGLNGTNFGPKVMVDDIRRHVPRAVIHGELAPFTYSRNEEVNIVLEFLRDFELTRATRGLRFTTAGSVNNGTRLTSARLVMAAVQRFGRF